MRVLQYLPKDDPNYPRFVKLHQEMSAALSKLQGADGLWRPSLLDAAEFPAPETSGTRVLLLLVRVGHQQRHARPRDVPARDDQGMAWPGRQGRRPTGKLGYVQKVAAAPGDREPARHARIRRRRVSAGGERDREDDGVVVATAPASS